METTRFAGVASCPCPCSDAILPKNTTAFQLRLVYQWRIRIRQGGEDPKFPIQPDPTRGHSEWRPTETKNYPPAWGPPPPSSLLQFFISPARSPAPSSATSSLAPSIAVPSASSSYPSSSPSDSASVPLLCKGTLYLYLPYPASISNLTALSTPKRR